MISKVPRWAWAGAGILSFVAGVVNSIGFLSFQHQGVTHVTGTTTLLGIAAAQSNYHEAVHFFVILISFMSGCVLAGLVVGDTKLALGRRYGFALLIESTLLFIAVLLLRQSNIMGAYFASCACGLQNAIVSTYSGAVIRTTHVSGVVTDLGIFLGHFLRGVPVDTRRIRLYLLLFSSFFSGSVAGSAGFFHFGYNTLYFPAVLTGVTGVVYGAYRHARHVTSR